MATDKRGHEVPTGPGPARRAAFDALSLSINDVVPVANATARAQALTDLGSSATKPLIVRQQDIGRALVHDGTRWRWLADTVLGRATMGSATVVAATPAWTTLASMTVDVLGGPLLIAAQAVLANANSGARRTGSIRVTVDGTAVTSPPGVDITLPYESGVEYQQSVSLSWESTPLAGSRTIALQANGSAAASVRAWAASLVVTERA